MRQLLICGACVASLVLGGCAWLNDLPFVHKPEIQQGNVLDQDAINQLQPGMSKTQVRFIMGTPLLVDVFHQERWDYIYSMQIGHQPREQKRLSIFFEDNRLASIKGDLQPEGGAKPRPKDVVISVPDGLPRAGGGLFSQTLRLFGVED